MNQNTRTSTLRFVRVLMLLILVISLLPAHQSVKAASACSCVGYVKAYLGIPSSEAVGNGKDMWKWLDAHGFQKLSGPQLGAVAVMQTTFPGADKTYGHVGIVVGINNGKITLRQNASGSSEFGCSNVGNVSWGTSVIGRTDIKFYAYSIYKIKTFITSSSTPSLNLDVSGGSKSAGAYVIGWTPHTGWNQQFYKIQYGQDYRIVNRNSALCLAPTSLNSGARIIQTTCGTGYDRWRISGNIIQNASNTGLVLDLAGGSLTPGNWIYLWRSQGSANQKWVFTQVSFQ